MTNREHLYQARLVWEGNRGDGTADYESYGREYRVQVEGKPDLLGSADAMFHGDPGRPNPEDLFLAAISSCHMLAYLALCARQRIRVVAYEDRPRGVLALERGGGGRFTEVELTPRVTVADPAHVERATALHERAHALCFVASSCRVPIRHRAEVLAQAGVPAQEATRP